MDRVLLLRPPKGGLPDPEYSDGETMIVARVQIYNTTDACRKFWERLREVTVQVEFREKQISKALYTSTDQKNKVIALICTHVDDMLWADTPGAESAIKRILDTFAVREVEQGTFRFCGKEVTQADD